MICPFPMSIKSPNIGYPTKYMAVPCGRCAACLKNNVTQWKIRLTEQARITIENSFLTLTYDDEHLPLSGVDKPEIQRFIKRLRHHYNFKYYLISEYGSRTKRAHYHAILFGVDTYSFSRIHKKKSLEEIIQTEWGNGNIKVDNINPQRINYVAEYHIGKYFNPPHSNKNFVLMSKGLGLNYVILNQKIHTNENSMYYREKNYKKALPRYYKEKLYDKRVIRKATMKIQEQTDIMELNQLNKNPKYLQEKETNSLHFQNEYFNKKFKKSKL